MALLHGAVRGVTGADTARSVQPARLIPVVAGVSDLCLLALATVIAMVGRQRLTIFDPRDDIVRYVIAIAAPLLLGWLALLVAVGAYSRDIFGAGAEEYKRVIKASLLSAGLVGIGCYLTGFPLSRGFYVLVFVVGVPLLVVGRLALRRFIQRARHHGHFRETVLLAGDPQHVDEIAAVLRRESWLGYTVLGALTTAGTSLDETPAGIPVLGDTRNASSIVEQLDAEVIVFAEGAFGSSKELRRAMWELEHLPVQAIVVPSMTDVSGERLKVRPVAGLPLVHLESPRAMDASRWAKRIFDVLGALGLLVALAPVTLATAVAIKFHDGGPVLFRQTRVGRDGRPFSCLKFRSMVVNAEQLRAELEANNERASVLFKMAEDPRVTKPGRVIRRFSLDELPQLWNVVRGHMSLVGPRPPLPNEVARYENDMNRRLRVRPGMTGLWQVSGRSDLSWDDTVRLDLYYVDNWSMVQDLLILCRTLSAVLSSRGAY
jgi:exopolysaccharide biosynthesis polyprenyl glycosylphosphotransferase